MKIKRDFGAFELHEKIGSGGMASVYLGVQKSLDRAVVLKILYPHLAEDEKLVARFEREARAAAMLKHENIVQVIDCGRHDDVAFIAMEFVEGMDLKRWLETHGPPPLEMALLVLRDICRGVEHAHAHRIVHRDVKPANIMLTPDGTIKIMDFGLARRGQETTTVTLAGSVLGTPAYMSPEQAGGDVVDERSDIFSVGVVGYELLGGTRPFQGDSYSTVLHAILTVEPPSLETLNPLVPAEVVLTVHKMLQKDVAKRYQSIGVMRGDLDAVIEEMGLHRSRDLLREYSADPARVTEVLQKKRLSRHLDQGLYLETLGLGKIDDAVREFQRVLFIDPKNADARSHLDLLEKERGRRAEEVAAPSVLPEDGTLVLDPGAMPPPPPPPPPAPRPAAPPLPPVAPAPASAPPPAPASAPPPAPASAPPPAPSRASAATITPPPIERPAPPSPARPAQATRARPVTEVPPRPAKRPPAPGAPAAPRAPSTPTQRLQRWLIGAAVTLALLVVAGVAAFVLGNRKADEAPRTAGEPSSPSQIKPTPEPAVPPSVTPAAPPEAPPATQPPSVPSGPATLLVTSQPSGALVILDRIAQHQRTAATFPNLGAGVHSLRLEKEGFSTEERQITLKAGAERTIAFQLKPVGAQARGTVTPARPAPAGAPGFIVVRANPYATYFVDGEEKAKDRTSARISVTAGSHLVRAVHPLGAMVWKKVVNPGETVELSYDFLATGTGSLRVTSRGNWARVFLDGKDTGKTTPCLLQSIPVGEHVVELRRENFAVEGGTKTTRVRAGETTEASFTVKPAR